MRSSRRCAGDRSAASIWAMSGSAPSSGSEPSALTRASGALVPDAAHRSSGPLPPAHRPDRPSRPLPPRARTRSRSRDRSPRLLAGAARGTRGSAGRPARPGAEPRLRAPVGSSRKPHPPDEVGLRDAVDRLQMEALLADGQDVEAAVRIAAGLADGRRRADVRDATAQRADLMPLADEHHAEGFAALRGSDRP